MAVLVKTTDEKLVEIEEPLIRLCGKLKETIAEPDYRSDDPISLENVDSRALAHVLKWLRHHVDDTSDESGPEDECENVCRRIKGRRTKEYRWRRRYMFVPSYDRNFLVEADNATLISIVNTAHQLKIKRLMEYACRAVADKMKNKSAEEIRQQFNIENDFSDDEEDITLMSVDRSRTANYKWKCTGS